tara:strand:+ start:102 stop:1208 length:1107 start_codon:yes stop_codon:yes gene_type:complete
MKKKEGIIIGWHDKKNIGDEATLYCLLKILKINLNLNKIYVLNNQNDVNFKLNYLQGIFSKNKYINYFIRFFLLKFYIKKSDIIVFGAGNTFQSIWSIKKKNNYLKYANKNAKIFALGVSLEVSKYEKDANLKKKVLNLLNKLNLLVVRDRKSFSFLKKYNVENIYYEKDVAHLLPNFIKTKKKNLKKTISISFRDWHDNPRNTGILLDKLSKLIYDIVKKYDFEKINLIPFSYDRSTLNDVDDLILIKDKLIKFEKKFEKKIFIYDKVQNFKTIYSLINNSDLVIGLRLHSQIFSLINDIPFLAFSYNEKVINYLEDKKKNKFYLLEADTKFNRKAIYRFLNKNLFLKRKINKSNLNIFKKIFSDVK